MSKNRHITPEQVERIVHAIHTWDQSSIGWEAVCKVAKPMLGYLPSRSGLSAHADIQAAFTARKKNLGQRPSGKMPSPGSLADASRMIAARDAEIASLKLLVTEYREKFDRWRYNAMLSKVTIDRLDAPLPQIERKS
ncbi:hypothetical protein E2K99_02190 [Herbaspirillum huttiense]|uniref:hypothetical protein n=1 Tax=Herbaspirillum huttiense TaxID=863372 RepID=UPI0010654D8F|nr:hypothetical protein [Herbaspirillum huttiense]QBP73892.1 hypothetical protein E2K99_02190 [Herbaspirillum huttiense]